MRSSDERVYKLIAAMAEQQILKILKEVKQVNIAQMKEPKSHVSFEDLQKALEEFDVALRRPPFVEERKK